MLTDIPLSPHTLRVALELLRELTLAQRPGNNAVVQLEKKVLSGEERLFNSTATALARQVYCNHFGDASQTCLSFPYSPQQRTMSFTDKDVASFFQKWSPPRAVGSSERGFGIVFFQGVGCSCELFGMGVLGGVMFTGGAWLDVVLAFRDVM